MNQEIDEKVLLYYNQAISAAFNNPSAAVYDARKAAERVCKTIINNAGKHFDSHASISSLLEQISKNRIKIDSRLLLSIRTIQQYANYGAHDQSFQASKQIMQRGDLSTEDIIPCINALKRMINIFFYEDKKTNITTSPVKYNLPTNYIVKIATSNLTVPDSIMQGWQCEEFFSMLNIQTQSIQRKWNDQILDDLADNTLDIAIYNKESALNYISKNPDREIHLLRDVCSSMGGRNFYVLATQGSKWNNLAFEDFKQVLSQGDIIAVSRNSDMEKNLLYTLDLTLEELENLGVKLIDYHSDQGLSLFDINNDILIIGGQDLRFLAEYKGGYKEILYYDMLPQEKKDFFYKNSINSLIVSSNIYKMCSQKALDDIVSQLLTNFYKSSIVEESKEKIRNRLRPQVRQITNDDNAVDYILQRILFETYRFF